MRAKDHLSVKDS